MGPFKPPEVRELLRKGEIRPDTNVRESASPEWHQVREVKAFLEYIKEVQGEREHHARERAFDAQEVKVRNKNRAPKLFGFFGLVVVLGAGGWFGYQRFQTSQAEVPSHYGEKLLRPLELTELPATAYARGEEDIDWADEKVAVRKATNRKAAKARSAKKTGNGGAKRPAAVGTFDDLAPEQGPKGVVELDMTSGGGSGIALMPADVQRVRSKAVPRLVSCAQKGSLTAPGTSVRFTIKPNGKMGSVQIGQNGKRSRGFVACVQNALRQITVSPFDSSVTAVGRTLTVPLKITD